MFLQGEQATLFFMHSTDNELFGHVYVYLEKKTDYYAILMQLEGWWSYEFCYHGRIRQVHVEGEKVRDSAPSILFLFSLWLATMVVKRSKFR
jgi:hypothetical protein